MPLQICCPAYRRRQKKNFGSRRSSTSLDLRRSFRVLKRGGGRLKASSPSFLPHSSFWHLRERERDQGRHQCRCGAKNNIGNQLGWRWEGGIQVQSSFPSLVLLLRGAKSSFYLFLPFFSLPVLSYCMSGWTSKNGSSRRKKDLKKPFFFSSFAFFLQAFNLCSHLLLPFLSFLYFPSPLSHLFLVS